MKNLNLNFLVKVELRLCLTPPPTWIVGLPVTLEKQQRGLKEQSQNLCIFFYHTISIPCSGLHQVHFTVLKRRCQKYG